MSGEENAGQVKNSVRQLEEGRRSGRGQWVVGPGEMSIRTGEAKMKTAGVGGLGSATRGGGSKKQLVAAGEVWSKIIGR